MKVSAQGLSRIDSYKLLCGSVVPRPIAWITTLSKNGKVNISPYSCFMHVSKEPPKIMFCITKQKPGLIDQELKDTEINIMDTKEFVVNIPSVHHAEAVDISADVFPYDTSEVELLNLKTVPSDIVRVPRLEDVGVSMECVLSDIGDFSGPDRMRMIVGEVKMWHIRDDIYDNGKIDTMKLNPLMRLGGPFYAGVGQVISVPARGENSHRPFTGKYS